MSVREQLKKVMAESNGKITQAAVARAIGMSPAVVNQYLDDKYKGDTEMVERKLNAYLVSLADEAREQIFVMPLVTTTTFKKVYEALRYSHTLRKLVIVSGEAGVGKTVAARAYCEERPNAILIEANITTTGADIIRTLYKLLVGKPSGSINAQFEAIIEELYGTGRILIVDECENLPPLALDILRRINDKALIGVVLMGKPAIIANVKKPQLSQVRSRVSIARKLSALQPEDTEDIVKDVLPDQENLWKIFHNVSKSNVRDLGNLLENSIRISKANKIPISNEVIRMAAEQLAL